MRVESGYGSLFAVAIGELVSLGFPSVRHERIAAAGGRYTSWVGCGVSKVQTGGCHGLEFSGEWPMVVWLGIRVVAVVLCSRSIA